MYSATMYSDLGLFSQYLTYMYKRRSYSANMSDKVMHGLNNSNSTNATEKAKYQQNVRIFIATEHEFLFCRVNSAARKQC